MIDRLSFETKRNLLLGLTVLIVTGTFFMPPVTQDAGYHRFADQTPLFGIPNFWNVVSNLPFLLVGLSGIARLWSGSLEILPEFRGAYLTFFVGVALVGPGSAYYHWNPDNASLVWDRLPMTVAFMALLAIVVAEYLSVSAARLLLVPLILAGLLSVFYWHFGELQGHGDLRPYGLVQFLSLLLIILMMILFPPNFSGAGYLWAMVAAYGGAKLSEALDRPIFEILGFISGHSIKHLLAALGAGFFLIGLGRRKKRP